MRIVTPVKPVVLAAKGGLEFDNTDAAPCADGSYAQGAGFAKLRTLIARQDATGPVLPFVERADAALWLSVCDHSCTSQQFAWPDDRSADELALALHTERCVNIHQPCVDYPPGLLSLIGKDMASQLEQAL